MRTRTAMYIFMWNLLNNQTTLYKMIKPLSILPFFTVDSALLIAYISNNNSIFLETQEYLEKKIDKIVTLSLFSCHGLHTGCCY